MDSTATPAQRRRTFRTVRGRMLFWIIAVTIPIYAAALYMSYDATARSLEAGAERDVDELAARLASRVDAVIRPIEGGIRTVAYQLEEIDPPLEQYPQRIRGILMAWPDVYGSTIAVEVGNAGANARPFAPYFYRHGADLGFSDLAVDSYGYRQLAWYRRAADSGQPVWSLPYFDAGGGNAWMVTYSVPFYRKLPDTRRVMAGVVTADLDLDWVKTTSANASLGPIGMGWLSSPSVGEPFVVPIGATAERIGKFDASMNRDVIRKIGEEMLAKKVTFGLLPRETTAERAYLAVRNLETLGWRVMLVIPKTELLAEARALLSRQLLLGAIGLVLLIAATSTVAAGIARPIRALAAAVGKAREDELDLQLPETPRRDEIGVLTEALRRMGSSLREHIRLRAQSLAEQARLEHDLKIAASIQQSMLPLRATAADMPAAIQIAAALLPAKQVGGDLYDYFLIQDGSAHANARHHGKVFLAIGDVSDKGIPAALFMARLSALLRVMGAGGEPPDRLLAAINARLSEGNDACMFVTIGCALLDVDTGRIRYASAGHEPPLVRDAEGTVKSLAAENGPAIGIEAVADYQLWEGSMAPGDTLVLFTDGVTEAEAPDGSLFGLERLSELLREAPGGHPAALVKRVVDTIGTHASGFHATDDLTVLAVRWNPHGVDLGTDEGVMHWHIRPEASDAGIRQTQQWLHGVLAAREVVPGRIAEAELIAEELLSNIVKAAGAEAHRVGLTVDCFLMPAEIVLMVRDDGPGFDPLAHPSPKLDADIADRPIGGLGIPLVKQLASDMSYARIDGWNVLEIRLGRSPDSN
jgi:sigma-B regulation protein RsbU (phosphoserine phosphatase)